MVETQEWFDNYYVHCKEVWNSAWSCMCNDDCPICGGEIEPYMSKDDDGSVAIHVDPDFIPENGWPDGINNYEELIDQ